MIKADRQEQIKGLLNDISVGITAGVNIRLDWENQSLTVNGFEFGHMIKRSTLWDFLAAVAIRAPRHSGLSVGDDSILPEDSLIRNRIKANNLRRELGRALPIGLTGLIVHTVRNKGYKLGCVRVPNSEAHLKFSDNADSWGDQPNRFGQKKQRKKLEE